LKVGDFALVEDFQMAFEAGEVLWCSEEYILFMGKSSYGQEQPKLARRNLQVAAYGSKQKIMSLNNIVQVS
jgi:hypothetical protein